MAYKKPLNERTRIYLPAYLDGSGMVALECSEGTAQWFRLHELPKATDPEFITWSSDGRWSFMTFPTAKLSLTRYRIAYGDPWPTGKQRSASFGLSKRHTKQTLEIICRHLNALNVDWLWLTNHHGNRANLQCFHRRGVAA